jgi:hypothetical protein
MLRVRDLICVGSRQGCSVIPALSGHSRDYCWLPQPPGRQLLGTGITYRAPRAWSMERFKPLEGSDFCSRLRPLETACVRFAREAEGWMHGQRYPSQVLHRANVVRDIVVILSVELPGQDSRCARSPGRILDTARSRRLFAL